MSKSTSTKQTDKINGRPLLKMGPHTILIDANATPFDLSEEIDRRITQAKGVTHLLCGINLSAVAGELADNCISTTAWGLTETLEEIETLSNQLWRCKAQPAPNQVIHPPEKKSIDKEAVTPADSLDDNLQIHFGPEVTAIEIANFIDKRLSQLSASLLMMQTDLYFEMEGMSALGPETRNNALDAVMDSVTQIQSAWLEYNNVVASGAST